MPASGKIQMMTSHMPIRIVIHRWGTCTVVLERFAAMLFDSCAAMTSGEINPTFFNASAIGDCDEENDHTRSRTEREICPDSGVCGNERDRGRENQKIEEVVILATSVVSRSVAHQCPSRRPRINVAALFVTPYFIFISLKFSYVYRKK